MRNRLAVLYQWLICTLVVAMVIFSYRGMSVKEWIEVFILAVVAGLLHRCAVERSGGIQATLDASVTMMAALCFGTFPMLCVALLSAVTSLVTSPLRLWKDILFNAAEIGVSLFLGTVAYLSAGGPAFASSWHPLWPYIYFFTVYVIANVLLPVVYIYLRRGRSFGPTLRESMLNLPLISIILIEIMSGVIMIKTYSVSGMPGVVFVSLVLLLFGYVSRQYSQAAQQSVTDAITGLYNRRFFQQTLRQQFRTGNKLALMLLDLDHFKQFNDSNGHPKGDALLVEIAQLILDQVGTTGVVCRYGGEEFAVILPRTDGEEALAIAERIRLSVMSHPFEGMQAMPEGRITLSIGIATHPSNAKDYAELLDAADQALYQVKGESRNGIKMYAPVTVSI